ncbi:membrane protein insertion efficiency factor YidD [Bombiscardovia apis]|uniref:membrane protein insertion efficiency factor YidD n=1 Tax=Bombiscardovia apis TaxID=2932182 RepID=UPI002953D4BF|nr:membrane protein insertion efficiency factor YidD [Bombiscardovia apis]
MSVDRSSNAGSSRRVSPFAKVCLHALDWYQRKISPLSPPSCRYYPTCSQYAVTAVEHFGAVRGISLATLRLLRCRPWSAGGIDDVPAQFSLCYRCSWSAAHEEPRLEPLQEQTTTEVGRSLSASPKETI